MRAEQFAREWEEFQGGPTVPAGDRRHVTLSVRCILLLNRKVFEEMGRPASVMLLFDRKNRTIGVRTARPDDVKPFTVKSHPKGSHHAIHAKPFCRYYQAIPKKAIRFTEPWLDREGNLVLSLKQTEPVVPKKRKALAE